MSEMTRRLVLAFALTLVGALSLAHAAENAVAVIVDVVGEACLQRPGGRSDLAACVGMSVFAGDVLKAHEGATVSLFYEKGGLAKAAVEAGDKGWTVTPEPPKAESPGFLKGLAASLSGLLGDRAKVEKSEVGAVSAGYILARPSERDVRDEARGPAGIAEPRAVTSKEMRQETPASTGQLARPAAAPALSGTGAGPAPEAEVRPDKAMGPAAGASPAAAASRDGASEADEAGSELQDRGPAERKTESLGRADDAGGNEPVEGGNKRRSARPTSRQAGLDAARAAPPAPDKSDRQPGTALVRASAGDDKLLMQLVKCRVVAIDGKAPRLADLATIATDPARRLLDSGGKPVAGPATLVPGSAYRLEITPAAPAAPWAVSLGYPSAEEWKEIRALLDQCHGGGPEALTLVAMVLQRKGYMFAALLHYDRALAAYRAQNRAEQSLAMLQTKIGSLATSLGSWALARDMHGSLSRLVSGREKR